MTLGKIQDAGPAATAIVLGLLTSQSVAVGCELLTDALPCGEHVLGFCRCWNWIWGGHQRFLRAPFPVGIENKLKHLSSMVR